ncbi:FecR domain-containing protein [Stenotrophomonas sp.]|uniref:FecR family protein n=1 Tax=Stenotrophomonas sp. TaxID=69392 RepID=UPI002FC602B8
MSRHPSALTLAAAHWHALQREGALDPERQQAFMRWLLASPDHLREYLAVSQVAGRLGEALRGMPVDLEAWVAAPAPAAAADNVVALPLRRAPTPPARPRQRRHLPGLAAAAALLVSLGIGATLAWPQTQHYAAGHGAPRRFTLPDHTVVHLNAESDIRVRYTLLGRRVELERGQASFVVAEERRPFEVHAAGLKVTDIGTTFDVSLQREQARVAVSEGRVQVHGDGGRGRLLADLGAGQGARVDYRDQRVQLETEDAASLHAWWQGRIVFRDEPLREVADRFNRLNRQRLQVSDEAGALRLTGNLRGHDLASLRVFLAQQPLLAIAEQPGGIVVRLRDPAAPAEIRAAP